MKFEDHCRKYLLKYVLFEEKKCFVAGGFFPRFYHNLPIRDIDIYVNDHEYFQTLENLYKELGYKQTRQLHLFSSFSKQGSPNIDLIAFHNPLNSNFVSTFDFTICQGWIDEFDHNIPTKDIVEKKLIFNQAANFNITSSDYGKMNNTLTRLVKYVKLGFDIDNEQLSLIHQALVLYSPSGTERNKHKGLVNNPYAP